MPPKRSKLQRFIHSQAHLILTGRRRTRRTMSSTETSSTSRSDLHNKTIVEPFGSRDSSIDGPPIDIDLTDTPVGEGRHAEKNLFSSFAQGRAYNPANTYEQLNARVEQFLATAPSLPIESTRPEASALYKDLEQFQAEMFREANMKIVHDLSILMQRIAEQLPLPSSSASVPSSPDNAQQRTEGGGENDGENGGKNDGNERANNTERGGENDETINNETESPDKAHSTFAMAREIHASLPAIRSLLQQFQAFNGIDKTVNDLQDKMKQMDQDCFQDRLITVESRIDKIGQVDRFDQRIDTLRNTVEELQNKPSVCQNQSKIDSLSTELKTLSSKIDGLCKSRDQLDANVKVAIRMINKLSPATSSSSPEYRSVSPGITPVHTSNTASVSAPIPSYQSTVRPQTLSLPQLGSVPTAHLFGQPPVASSELRIPETRVQSSSPTSTSSTAQSSAIKIHERRLQQLINTINDLTSENLAADDISDDVLIDIFKNVIPSVERISAQLNTSALNYADRPDYSPARAEAALDATESATLWVTRAQTLYRTRQLHLEPNTILTGSLTLTKFTGDYSQSVYDFLHRFEQFTKSGFTQSQRAVLLYQSYLSQRICQEMAAISQDYPKMKQFLIKEYGQVNLIIDSHLRALRALKVPSAGSSKTNQADYYRSCYSILAGIQSLPNTPGIPKNDLTNIIYSHETIRVITSLLPSITQSILNRLRDKSLDTSLLQGKGVFDVIIEIVKTRFADLDFVCKLQGNSEPKEKERSTQAKNVHVTQAAAPANDNSSQSPAVHFQSSPKQSRKQKKNNNNNKTTNNQNKGKSWYNSIYKHPCPINKHDHEIGTCRKFFDLDPKSRRYVMGKKSCVSCFGPRDKCGDICPNLKRIPVRLICQECSNLAATFNKSPYNILVCNNSEHSKVSRDDTI